METLVAAIPPTATAAIGIITLPVLDISTPLAMALTEIAAVPLLPPRRSHLPPLKNEESYFLVIITL